MSMVRCQCGNLIDSDDDPECFTEEGDGPILCEPCRDEADAERDRCDKADAANDQAWLDARHGIND